MDSDEPMDTDEPWGDKSYQADEPTGSRLTPPANEFVPVLCGCERNPLDNVRTFTKAYQGTLGTNAVTTITLSSLA